MSDGEREGDRFLPPWLGFQRRASNVRLSWNVFFIIADPLPNLEELSTYFSSMSIVWCASDVLPKAGFRSLKKPRVGISAIPNDHMHTALGLLIGAHCRLSF